MKKMLIILAAISLFCACGTKNPTVRDTVKKKIGDSQTVGVNEFKKGNYASAKLFLESALKDAYTIDNVEGMVDAMQNLAEVHLRLDNFNDASNYIFRAKAVCEEEGLGSQFAVLQTIGKYYDKTAAGAADHEKAMQAYRTALTLARSDQEKALVYNSIGIASMKRNKLDDATEWFTKSRDINEAGKVYDTLADNYFNLGEVSERKGDNQGALLNYQKALQNDKIAEKSDGIVDDLKKIGTVYSRLNDRNKALFYLNRAYNSAESMGYRSDLEEIQKLISAIK